LVENENQAFPPFLRPCRTWRAESLRTPGTGVTSNAAGPMIPRPPPGYALHASVVAVCTFAAYLGIILAAGASSSAGGMARAIGGVALIGGSGFALVRWWRSI
jgi:hypothetical protein